MWYDRSTDTFERILCLTDQSTDTFEIRVCTVGEKLGLYTDEPNGGRGMLVKFESANLSVILEDFLGAVLKLR